MSYLRDKVGFFSSCTLHFSFYSMCLSHNLSESLSTQILKIPLKTFWYGVLEHTVHFKRPSATFVCNLSLSLSLFLSPLSSLTYPHFLLFQAEQQGDCVCDPCGSSPRHHPGHGGHQLCWAEEPRGQVQLHRRSHHSQDRAWLEYCQVRTQSFPTPHLGPNMNLLFWVEAILKIRLHD